MPFPNPHELLLLWGSDGSDDKGRTGISPGNFQDLLPATTLDVFAYQQALEVVPESESKARVLQVTSGFFPVLGIRPLLGAGGGPREGEVWITEAYWKQRFGGRADVLGQTLILGGENVVVRGVLPLIELTGEPVDCVRSLELSPDLKHERGVHFLRVAGRLKGGATLRTARAELSALGESLRKNSPNANQGLHLVGLPLSDALVGHLALSIWVVQAIGLVILAVAVLTLTGLAWSEFLQQAHDLGVRIALGARQWLVWEQLILEVWARLLAASLLGAMVSWWVVRLVLTSEVPSFLKGRPLEFGEGSLVFHFVQCFLIGAVVTSVPLASAMRVNWLQVLMRPDLSMAPRRMTAHGWTLAAQIALSLALVVSAGRMTVSIRAFEQIPLGFQARGLAALPLPSLLANERERAVVLDSLLDRIRSVPEAEGATVTLMTEIETWIERSDGSRVLTDSVLVQPASWNHVQTMGLRLVAGRWFSSGTAERDVAINMTMARELAPTAQDALGRRVSLRSPDRGEWFDVVAVVDDVKTSGLTSPSRPEIYIPYEFTSAKPLYVLVRSSLDTPVLAEALASIGKDIGLGSWKPSPVAMSQHAHRSLALRRFMRTLLLLGGVGCGLLMLMGVYSITLRQALARRTELAVRAALGARSSELLWSAGRPLFIALFLGTLVGVWLAYQGESLVQRFLYGALATGPWLLVAIVAALWTTVLLALLAGAWPALRSEPSEVLRNN